MSNRIVTIVVLLLALAAPASGGDEEGCLFCHRLPLRLGTAAGERELRVSDAQANPHSRLFCSDCHPDARTSPHASPPGSARCTEACHDGTAGTLEAHRKASFGGLTERHRGVAGPGGPCRLCHRMADPAGGKGSIAGRCAACHPGQRDAVARGVHKTVVEGGAGASCTACHLAHASPAPGVAEGRAVNCVGPLCHARITEGMRSHGGHREGSGGAGGRAVRVGGVLVVALLGVLPGLLLGLGNHRRGDDR